MSQDVLSEDAWKEMDAEILAAIDTAVRYAQDSPFPDPEMAVEDVFSD